MASQLGKDSSSSERPSFFGLPAGWSQLGPQFWGGVLVGVGLGAVAGLAVAGVMADSELPAISAWLVGVPALALVLIGRSIAQRAVRRSRQTETALAQGGTAKEQ